MMLDDAVKSILRKGRTMQEARTTLRPARRELRFSAPALCNLRDCPWGLSDDVLTIPCTYIFQQPFLMRLL